MKNDLAELIYAVFIDSWGENPLVVQRFYPLFNTEKITGKIVLPGIAENLPADGRAVIAWNFEYQTPGLDRLQPRYYVRGAKPIGGEMPEHHVFFSWHLSETVRANPRRPLHPPVNAHYLADALLGINKPERVELFRLLDDTGLLERCLVNLYASPQFHDGGVAYSTPQLAALDDPRVSATKIDPANWHSMSQVVAESGKIVPASQIIPWRICESAWVSLVAETYLRDDQFFITEKIGKAFAAGRIFLLQGGRGYLRQLRTLGFKTFAPYIDESYDEIGDISARNAAIVAELKRLSTENLALLYQAVLPILKHNQQLMYSGELNKPAQRFLRMISERYK